MSIDLRIFHWKNVEFAPDYGKLVTQCNDMPYMQNRRVKVDVSENALCVLKTSSFALINRSDKIELAMVTLKQLGLRPKVSRGDIYARAKEMGFTKCPQDTGPKLRLQFLEQREGDRLAIGTEPIAHDGHNDIFTLDRDHDTLWLRAVSGSANVLWDADFVWVFAIPEPPKPRLIPPYEAKSEKLT